MAKHIDIDQRRRGREAQRPGEIPAPGWRDILLRTRAGMNENNLSLVAAGVAFYLLLSIFPALAAMISIYGLIADPVEVERQMSSMMAIMPPQAADILLGQMRQLASQPSGGLSVGVAVGVLLALWSASKGVKALIQGLNIAYDEREKRGFIKLNAVALLLTVGGIVVGMLTLALVAVLPALLSILKLPDTLSALLSLSRWPILLVVLAVSLAVVYRYAPSRDQPQWRWASPGAAVAIGIWLLASIGFSVYVANFGSYSKTYGSVGAIVILMTWFYLFSYVVLAGAKLNAEMEHQTGRDTTVGPERPLGERDAQVADTVGKRP